MLGMNGANEDRAFTVRHFAGDVAYDVAQFIAKNSETMEAMTAALLQVRARVRVRVRVRPWRR